MSDIIDVGPLWFPPANILYHGEQKLDEELTSDQEKQIREAMAAAIMLVGIDKQTGKSHRLQLVDPRERTPDIRTMRLSEEDGFSWLDIQEVEVVRLEANSVEDVDGFLKRTKLASKKAYPPTTVILCHVDKRIENHKSWEEIHRSLQGVVPRNDVYVLARVDPIKQKYHLAKVHPDLAVVEFDVHDELFSKPKQPVMKLVRSTKPFLERSGETHLPFNWSD